MSDYEEKYKAFCIDDKMKRDFSNYSVGVEILSPLGDTHTETILIEGGKTTITQKESKHA